MKPSILKYRYWLKYNLLFFMEHLMGPDYFKKPGSAKDKLIRDIGSDLSGHAQLPENKPLRYADPAAKPDCSRLSLYKGMAKSWPAYRKWTMDYFKEVYGDRDVLINASNGLVDPKAPQQTESIKLKNYIEELELGTRKYLKLSDLAKREKSLQEDLDLKWLKSFKPRFAVGETYYMFIGGKGTVTPMHNEFSTTIYVQVFGQKKWTLYPPEDRVYLNAVTERRPYFFSNYVPGGDNKDYSLGQYAEKIEIIMEPGDVLVLPNFYFHYVENLSDSIGVAYKFADVFSALKVSKLFTLLIFLSTRPSIFYSFFAGRIKKQDMILSKE